MSLNYKFAVTKKNKANVESKYKILDGIYRNDKIFKDFIRC